MYEVRNELMDCSMASAAGAVTQDDSRNPSIEDDSEVSVP